MGKDRYTYPAVFHYADDGISVEFPDLPGCLTFGNTTEEAMKHGYCEGTAENIEAVLTQAGYAAGTYTLQVYEPSTMDNLKGILTNTFLQSILIMLIIGGIYFELQTPGIGFPL